MAIDAQKSISLSETGPGKHLLKLAQEYREGNLFNQGYADREAERILGQECPEHQQENYLYLYENAKQQAPPNQTTL